MDSADIWGMASGSGALAVETGDGVREKLQADARGSIGVGSGGAGGNCGRVDENLQAVRLFQWVRCVFLTHFAELIQ